MRRALAVHRHRHNGLQIIVAGALSHRIPAPTWQKAQSSSTLWVWAGVEYGMAQAGFCCWHWAASTHRAAQQAQAQAGSSSS